MQIYNNQLAPNLIDFFKLGAESGHSQAKWQLGCCYLEGRFVKKDIEKGKSLIIAACKDGNPNAYKTLAKLILDGKVFKQNKHIAYYYLRKAAYHGDSESQLQLAKEILSLANPSSRELEDGLHFLKMAHFNNIKEATLIRYLYLSTQQYDKTLDIEDIYRNLRDARFTSKPEAYLGLYHYYGNDSNVRFDFLDLAIHYKHQEAKAINSELKLYSEDTKKVSEGATEIFELVEKGQAYALNVLGDCFFDGRGCPKVKDLAQYYWKNAFLQGHLSSPVNMAFSFFASKDQKINFETYSAIKESICFGTRVGIQKCFDYMGMLPYYYPAYTNINEEERRSLLDMGVYHNITSSMHILAEHYQKSNSEKDIKLAAYLLAAAGDRSVSESFNLLGKLIIQKESLSKYFSQGIHFLQIAHQIGNEDASYELGLLYKDGNKNIIKNRTLAKDYFKAAMEEGHLGAKQQLALMYSYGIGIPEDESQAAHLLHELSQELPPDESMLIKLPIKNNVIKFRKLKRSKK